MKRAVVFAGFLLAACGPAALTTPCGMYVDESQHAADWESVLRLERNAVAWRVVACGALEGWTLSIGPEEKWRAPSGCVAGQMNCDSRGILTGPGSESLAHEFAHVAECPTHNYGHTGWDSPDAQGLSTFGRIEMARTR